MGLTSQTTKSKASPSNFTTIWHKLIFTVHHPTVFCFESSTTQNYLSTPQWNIFLSCLPIFAQALSPSWNSVFTFVIESVFFHMTYLTPISRSKPLNAAMWIYSPAWKMYFRIYWEFSNNWGWSNLLLSTTLISFGWTCSTSLTLPQQ